MGIPERVGQRGSLWLSIVLLVGLLWVNQRETRDEITVRGLQINAGAGFLVVLTGDILRMPGLPSRPLAERIDVRKGRIIGLD